MQSGISLGRTFKIQGEDVASQFSTPDFLWFLLCLLFGSASMNLYTKEILKGEKMRVEK